MNIMKILFENCDPERAEDRDLPNNSFLVEYKVEEGAASSYDIAAAAKQVEIFDHYYDKYSKGFVTMKQTEGRINPKFMVTKHPKTKRRSDFPDRGKKSRQKFHFLKFFKIVS